MSVLFGVLGFWVLVLTAAIVWLVIFFRRLTKGTQENELTRVLSTILKVQKENCREIVTEKGKLEDLERQGQTHLQKTGLVRFNPFKEIGGDHSFSLALLDGENSGVIVTCLHTRERTRVYMKTIKKGKSELELSEEEKKALAKACKI